MNWGDERYARVYCRNTIDLIAMGWQARAVWWELLRHADRSGVIPLGKHGTRGLAALIDVPADVVADALPILANDGCVQVGTTELVIPNYLAAQEAPRSDAARKREQREREREKAMLATSNTDSVPCPGHENVTVGHENVTPSHEPTSGRVAGHEMSLSPSLPSLQCSAGQDAVASRAPDHESQTAKPSRVRKAGSRLDPSWTPSPDLLSWARAKGIVERDVASMAERFRDHWLASTLPSALKADWSAAFRTWVGRDIDTGKVVAMPPRPAVVPPPPPTAEQIEMRRSTNAHVAAAMAEMRARTGAA